jgi:ABC-type dipeptide/oligopeptide/nickel transport system ATPase subunit
MARIESSDQEQCAFRGQKQHDRAGDQEDGWRFGSHVQMIFSDRFLGYRVKRLRILSGPKQGKSLMISNSVGLRPGSSFLEKFPFELTGGQQHRVAIPRVQAVRPALTAARDSDPLDRGTRTAIMSVVACTQIGLKARRRGRRAVRSLMTCV